MPQDHRKLAAQLVEALGLQQPPLAITFAQAPPRDVPAYAAPMPAPTADGRTGRARF